MHGAARFHAGVDLASQAGSPIRATQSGSVASAGWSGNYGYMVVLDHGNGVETRYAHMSAISVEAGRSVQQGDVIGLVGSSGRSTGPHVHYEVRIDGLATNPLPR
ncbi:M23 family metallopeptidase [Sphingopyxis sp. YR583]|uniref:M23 family metallopeptidase n=1 Tax=Sphingopyxis sp. YR583 TaxID=1881047 RepID=UPI003529AA56